MGKQSKRIHRWSIYLQDLRAEYDRCVEGKFMESDKLAESTKKAIDSVVTKYGTSKKSPLK